MLMLKRLRKAARRGFTAVEIAMVASIIAILALLILPTFRKRSEEAKKTAARDEVASLAKALLLVEADLGSGYMPQLSDLDNRENAGLTAATSSARDLEPPRLRWVQGTGAAGANGSGFFDITPDTTWQSVVVKNWQGPYVALSGNVAKTTNLTTIANRFPQLTWNPPASYGPIFASTINPFTAQDLAADRYPLDPWGTPYLFFGADETTYNFRAVYSLGPDGVPGGNNPTPAAVDYNRRTGLLGTGDDEFYLF